MSPSEKLLFGKRCLVLDDEFLIALDIQSMLEAAGAEVSCVGNSEDALRLLDGAAGFDLAVLDVKLGDGRRTSLRVATALRARGTPFVFLTGMRGDDIHTAQFPDVPLVEKPYDAALLMDAVTRALAPRSP